MFCGEGKKDWRTDLNDVITTAARDTVSETKKRKGAKDRLSDNLACLRAANYDHLGGNGHPGGYI